MKKVYLIRHAEKGSDGLLTEEGELMAVRLGEKLPSFSIVVSSPSSRARRTAELTTSRSPNIDERAGFYMASKEKSDAINQLANDKGITFLEALLEYGDEEVMNGVDKKATELNKLITELLSELSDGEAALILSHDLSISPAMSQRDIPLASIDSLHGYTINDKEKVEKFNPNKI